MEDTLIAWTIVWDDPRLGELSKDFKDWDRLTEYVRDNIGNGVDVQLLDHHYSLLETLPNKKWTTPFVVDDKNDLLTVEDKQTILENINSTYMLQKNDEEELNKLGDIVKGDMPVVLINRSHTPYGLAEVMITTEGGLKELDLDGGIWGHDEESSTFKLMVHNLHNRVIKESVAITEKDDPEFISQCLDAIMMRNL